MIGPFRLLALLLLGIWLLGRRKTRSWPAAAVLTSVLILVVVSQMLLEPPARHVVQGAIYAAGWFIAIWDPAWLLSSEHQDSIRFTRVDHETFARLRDMERAFEAGRLTAEEYDRQYGECIERLRGVTLTDHKWAVLRDEAVVLMSEWRELLAGRSEAEEATYQELEARQKELRWRIRELQDRRI